jgi:sugar lactone lactonase YvrE
LTRDVVLFDIESNDRWPIARIDHARPNMRLNDGKVGPDGAFWVGSMDASGAEAPAGALYRVTSNGDVRCVVTGFCVSNGLAWNAEAARMYHADSRGGHWIDAWDFDAEHGTIANRQRIVESADALGRADGGACDISGCYWSAGPSAGRINRFSAQGSLLGGVELPISHPTMPCFGGADLRTVFVTGLDSGSGGGGGNDERFGVVRFRATVAGVPICAFAD